MTSSRLPIAWTRSPKVVIASATGVYEFIVRILPTMSISACPATFAAVKFFGTSDPVNPNGNAVTAPPKNRLLEKLLIANIFVYRE